MERVQIHRHVTPHSPWAQWAAATIFAGIIPFLFLFSQAFISQQCAYNPIDSGSTDPFFVIFSFSSMQFLRLFQKQKEGKRDSNPCTS